MLRLVSKREMLLWAGTVQDLRNQIKALEEQVKHERARAEGAINALLIKTNRIAITPQENMTIKQEEDFKDKQYNIFGEGEIAEDKALEELQK